MGLSRTPPSQLRRRKAAEPRLDTHVDPPSSYTEGTETSPPFAPSPAKTDTPTPPRTYPPFGSAHAQTPQRAPSTPATSVPEVHKHLTALLTDKQTPKHGTPNWLRRAPAGTPATSSKLRIGLGSAGQKQLRKYTTEVEAMRLRYRRCRQDAEDERSVALEAVDAQFIETMATLDAQEDEEIEELKAAYGL